MTRFTPQILACLLTFGLLVQATFGRSDSLVCFGHLHPGSCSAAIDSERSHSEDCDHGDGIKKASVEQERYDSHECCCLDVQLTAQQPTLTKRIDLVGGFKRILVIFEPPVGTAAIRAMPLTLRFDARDGPAPRADLRARSVILQI